VFVSKPRNHFPLDEQATMSWLFAGGIGVTPLIAMAHRLHTIGRPFMLHYSAPSRSRAGFVADLESVPWREQVRLHFSDAGTRADLDRLVAPHAPGQQLYTCGSARYMDAVFDAARSKGWPQEALHREYFQVPEAPAREMLPFELELPDGRRLAVRADQRATDVMQAAGIAIDVKCTDGLCGVCARRYDAEASDPVDHRDVVLSAAQRRERVILCCSRSERAGGVIRLSGAA
jgi:ferredoxin-NADP reductase